MLSEEERRKNIIFHTHFFQRVKEHRHLFPDKWKFKECARECINAFKDPMKSVVLKDTRPYTTSNYICVFIGQNNYVIVVPCLINDDGITFATIEDPRKDYNDPNWFVRRFNEIAEKRGMTRLSYLIK